TIATTVRRTAACSAASRSQRPSGRRWRRRSRSSASGAATKPRTPLRASSYGRSPVSAPQRDIALAATLHDPPGALLGDIARFLPKLQRLYATVAVATSPPTDERVRALLAEHGADAGPPPSN